MPAVKKSAYERTRELHQQLEKGCVISPSVHIVLLKELCDEHAALLARTAPSEVPEKKSGK